MEHFIKTAFWIAILFGCLQAVPLPKDSKISSMRKHVNCPPDSTFYTPANVKDECIPAALDCVKKELQTVKTECTDDNQYIPQSVEYWEMMITEISEKGLVPKNSIECPPCETWSQTSFSDFLEKITTLSEHSHTILKG